MWFLAILLWAGLCAVAADPLQTVFDRAVEALSAQDFAAAEQGFQTVLKARPGHVGALGNLGVVYSRTHRYAKAIDAYRRALLHAPSDTGLLLNLGLAYIKQERYADGLPLFAKIVSANSTHRQAMELLATCQIYTGQPAQAAVLLESMRASEPRDTGVLYLLGVAYIRLKQPEKATEVFAGIMNAANPAQANFLMGKAEYEGSRFEEAAERFRKTIEAEPDFPSVHRELGKVLISLRRDDEADAELRLAIKSDSQDAEALYFLGGMMVRQSRMEQAAPLLERARALTPDFWGCYYYLGRIRLQEEKLAEAVALLERAARLNPPESAVYYQLSRAFKLSGREADSRRALEKVRELQAVRLREEVETLAPGKP